MNVQASGSFTCGQLACWFPEPALWVLTLFFLVFSFGFSSVSTLSEDIDLFVLLKISVELWVHSDYRISSVNLNWLSSLVQSPTPSFLWSCTWPMFALLSFLFTACIVFVLLLQDVFSVGRHLLQDVLSKSHHCCFAVLHCLLAVCGCSLHFWRLSLKNKTKKNPTPNDHKYTLIPIHISN